VAAGACRPVELERDSNALISAMPINWRSSREAFEQILRRHQLNPEAVDDLETAWMAFGEFMQLEIGGIQDVADDGDGFIAEWGSYSRNRELPAITFGRLLAVNDYDGSDREDPYWQPQYWRVDLETCFAPHPDLTDVDALGFQDTGFDFFEIGHARTDALAEVRAFIHGYPQLVAMWHTKPLHSRLTLDQAG